VCPAGGPAQKVSVDEGTGDPGQGTGTVLLPGAATDEGRVYQAGQNPYRVHEVFLVIVKYMEFC